MDNFMVSICGLFQAYFSPYQLRYWTLQHCGFPTHNTSTCLVTLDGANIRTTYQYLLYLIPVISAPLTNTYCTLYLWYPHHLPVPTVPYTCDIRTTYQYPLYLVPVISGPRKLNPLTRKQRTITHVNTINILSFTKPHFLFILAYICKAIPVLMPQSVQQISTGWTA
jgi:hypothetical protein